MTAATPTSTSPPRAPYWLTVDQRDLLADVIGRHLAAADPPEAGLLGEVRVELGVALARQMLWPEPVDLARRAAGQPADVMALRLTPAERDAVLDLPDLPPQVRELLAPSLRRPA